ncbi:hypothetical protein RQP46_011206 [Phenoliferia psychrophenolica]
MADPTPLPGSLPTAPAPTPQLDPRAAALLAAEARSKLPPSEVNTNASSAHTSSPSAPFNPSAGDKLPFHRLLDSELLPKCSKPQAVKTLDILLTMTENILNPPDPTKAAKYRQVRLANSNIKRNIMDVNGAFEYLIAAGFRQVNQDFEATLTFSPSPSPTLLHKIRCANYVLKDVNLRAIAANEREKRFRESEVDAEKARVGKVMLGFEEDRRLKREKDERDKIVRDAKAKQAAEAALAPPDLPMMGGPSDAASTMDIDREEEDDGQDPPPSYGALHGRVLGTGQAITVAAPRGVRMTHAQDEEYSEDEGGAAD